ncbi:MAG: S8 family serine peptidase [Bdellovibrionota bacterium]
MKKISSLFLSVLFFVQSSFALSIDKVELSQSLQEENNYNDVPQEFRPGGKFFGEWVFKSSQKLNEQADLRYWHLKGENEGFLGGIDLIKAKQSGLIGAPQGRVKVAVIDGGANLNHEQIAPYVAKNSGEIGQDKNGRDKSSNGIDDDGDGLVDDYAGWNFVGIGNQDSSLEIARMYFGNLLNEQEVKEYKDLAWRYELLQIGLVKAAQYLENVFALMEQETPGVTKNHANLLAWFQTNPTHEYTKAWNNGYKNFIYFHGQVAQETSRAIPLLKKIGYVMQVDYLSPDFTLDNITTFWDELKENRLSEIRQRNFAYYSYITGLEANWDRTKASLSKQDSEGKTNFDKIKAFASAWKEEQLLLFASDLNGNESAGTISVLGAKAEMLATSFEDYFSRKSFAKSKQAKQSNDVKERMTHGSHVNGIIAKIFETAFGEYYAKGNLEILHLVAVSDGDEKDEDVAGAINRAVQWGAQVVNMSFGKGYSANKKLVDEAVKAGEAKGVIFVHASGNEARDHQKYPSPVYASGGKYPYWLEVGATSYLTETEHGLEGSLAANFSNYGSWVDVLAPGMIILGPNGSDGAANDAYLNLQGTSMAAPVVTGCIAVLRALYPRKSSSEIIEMIKANTLVLENEKMAYAVRSEEMEMVLLLGGIRKNTYVEGQDLTYIVKDFGEVSNSGVINMYNILTSSKNFEAKN